MTVDAKRFGQLPSQRNQRRVILVLDDASIEALDRSRDATDVVDKEGVVVLHAAARPSGKLHRSLDEQGLLVPGNLLIASPYRDGDYARVDEATEHFSLEKWASISTLCGLLGASSVRVKELRDEQVNSEANGEGKVKRLGTEVSVSVQSSKRGQSTKGLIWDEDFSGGQADLAGARSFLQKSGLHADPELRSLVEGRSFAGNPLVRRRFELDLSLEVNRTLDMASSLNLGPLAGIGVQVQTAKTIRTRRSVVLEIEFAS